MGGQFVAGDHAHLLAPGLGKRAGVSRLVEQPGYFLRGCQRAQPNRDAATAESRCGPSERGSEYAARLTRARRRVRRTVLRSPGVIPIGDGGDRKGVVAEG